MGSNIGTVATEKGVSVDIIGELSAFPDRRYDHEKWIVTVEKYKKEHQWIPAEGLLLVRIPHENGLSFGDKVLLSGTLKIPFQSDDFSYRDYLSKDGIFSVMNYPKFQKTGETSRHIFLGPLYHLRVWFDQELRWRIRAPESAFAAGILIGDRSGFSPDLSQSFQKTGLSHLLALSGYNITIIALAVFFMTIWLPKIIRIIITIVFLSLFVLFVGGGASIIRAAIMGSIGLFIVHSGRKAEGFSLLFLASMVMVGFRPLILAYDPSFQLSIAGVLGLLLFSEPLGIFFGRFITSRYWTEILTATIGAQLGVFPLITFLFGQISIVSPLANLCIVPLIPMAMLFSFLSVVMGVFFPLMGDILAFVSWNILHVGLVVVQFLGNIPGASIPFQTGIIGFLILLFLLSVSGIFLLYRRSES